MCVCVLRISFIYISIQFATAMLRATVLFFWHIKRNLVFVTHNNTQNNKLCSLTINFAAISVQIFIVENECELT